MAWNARGSCLACRQGGRPSKGWTAGIAGFPREPRGPPGPPSGRPPSWPILLAVKPALGKSLRTEGFQVPMPDAADSLALVTWRLSASLREAR